MKYPVILADPPVPFETWGKRPGGIDSRAAEAHYSTMTWDDLYGLGPAIEAVADEHAALFLWVCQPLLVETLELARRWGFAYKTKAFSWVKLTPSRGMSFHVGMGYWTRANTEDVLLCTRGNPKRLRKDVYQVLASLMATPDETPAVLAPVARHSQKAYRGTRSHRAASSRPLPRIVRPSPAGGLALPRQRDRRPRHPRCAAL